MLKSAAVPTVASTENPKTLLLNLGASHGPIAEFTRHGERALTAAALGA